MDQSSQKMSGKLKTCQYFTRLSDAQYTAFEIFGDSIDYWGMGDVPNNHKALRCT